MSLKLIKSFHNIKLDLYRVNDLKSYEEFISSLVPGDMVFYRLFDKSLHPLAQKDIHLFYKQIDLKDLFSSVVIQSKNKTTQLKIMYILIPKAFKKNITLKKFITQEIPDLYGRSITKPNLIITIGKISKKLKKYKPIKY